MWMGTSTQKKAVPPHENHTNIHSTAMEPYVETALDGDGRPPLPAPVLQAVAAARRQRSRWSWFADYTGAAGWLVGAARFLAHAAASDDGPAGRDPGLLRIAAGLHQEAAWFYGRRQAGSKECKLRALEARAAALRLRADAGSDDDIAECMRVLQDPVLRADFDDLGSPILEDTMVHVGNVLAATRRTPEALILWRQAAHMHWLRARAWAAADVLIKAAVCEQSTAGYMQAAHMCVCAGRWQVAGSLCFAAFLAQFTPSATRVGSLQAFAVPNGDVDRFVQDADKLLAAFRRKTMLTAMEAEAIATKYAGCVLVRSVLREALGCLGAGEA